MNDEWNKNGTFSDNTPVQALEKGKSDSSGSWTPTWTLAEDNHFSSTLGASRRLSSQRSNMPSPSCAPTASRCSRATGPGHTYLDHRDIVPVWQALNEKGAVVIVHPTHAVDTTLVAGAVPQPTVDYPHETTRVAVSLIAADTLNLHAPNCKVILSHAGGMLPYLANRVAVLPEVTDLLDKTRDAILAAIASFYYNVPLSSDEETIRLLLQYTTPDHLQYGTDYPYTPAKVVTRFADEVREGIHGENALSLFPRLRKE